MVPMEHMKAWSPRDEAKKARLEKTVFELKTNKHLNPFFPPCYITLTLLYLQSKDGAQLAA